MGKLVAKLRRLMRKNGIKRSKRTVADALPKQDNCTTLRNKMNTLKAQIDRMLAYEDQLITQIRSMTTDQLAKVAAEAKEHMLSVRENGAHAKEVAEEVLSVIFDGEDFSEIDNFVNCDTPSLDISREDGALSPGEVIHHQLSIGELGTDYSGSSCSMDDSSSCDDSVSYRSSCSGSKSGESITGESDSGESITGESKSGESITDGSSYDDSQSETTDDSSSYDSESQSDASDGEISCDDAKSNLSVKEQRSSGDLEMSCNQDSPVHHDDLEGVVSPCLPPADLPERMQSSEEPFTDDDAEDKLAYQDHSPPEQQGQLSVKEQGSSGDLEMSCNQDSPIHHDDPQGAVSSCLPPADLSESMPLSEELFTGDAEDKQLAIAYDYQNYSLPEHQDYQLFGYRASSMFGDHGHHSYLDQRNEAYSALPEYSEPMSADQWMEENFDVKVDPNRSAVQGQQYYFSLNGIHVVHQSSYGVSSACNSFAYQGVTQMYSEPSPSTGASYYQGRSQTAGTAANGSMYFAEKEVIAHIQPMANTTYN